ncbi:asparagine synthase-related protein [Shewanella sp. 10N.286.51.B2]|uniref:asparagine synthase-related protein n=1 Tax=Shewanella sp. 10N.286.51.B2 TaxID=3229707 RepID=UPI003552D937
MPGIYGLVSSETNSTKNIAKMMNAMNLYPHFVNDEVFDDSIVTSSKVHLGHNKDRFKNEFDDSISVWVEGEAYNLSQMRDDFDFDFDFNLASALKSAYKNDKLNDFLNKLDGYFCGVLYDQSTSEIKLISDRYGMRMLYWYWNNEQFAWASEVKGILALDGVDKTIDPTSFQCFMELGYLLGEHTWFDKIKLIKPATIVTFNIKDKLLSEQYYWKWSEIIPSNISFDDAVEKLGKLFIEAVEKRFDVNEHIGVAISGGMDSRAIFAAIKTLHPEHNGAAYTFGIKGCDDIRIAELVINKPNSQKWDYKKFFFNQHNWFEPRHEMIWNTDGMQDMMHMHGGEFLDDISEHMSIMVNGYSGDVILGGGFLGRVPFNVRASKDNLRSFFKSHVSLINVDDDFYDIERVEPILQMNRVRRFTAMGTVNTLVKIDHRKPFFDNKVVELVYSLPDEYRKNNKLYSAMLIKFFPEYFKDIPWQKTGKPVGILKKPTLVTRAFRKILRDMRSIVGIKSLQEYTDYANWIRDEEISNYLLTLLDKKTACYAELTELDLSEKFLIPHLKGKRVNNSNEILRAATIELYLRNVNKY